MKKHYIILLCFLSVALVTLAGCCKKQYPTAGVTVYQDSTTTRTFTERDTILPVPAANVGISIPLKDISKDFKGAVKQSSQSRVQVSVKHTGSGTEPVLEVQCDCDSMAIAAKLRDTHVSQQSTKVITRTVKQPYTPPFIKFLAWTGGIALLILAVFLIVKYFVK